MATPEEQEVERLRLRVEALKRAMADLDAQVQSGYISTTQFARGQAQLGREMKATEREFLAAEKAAGGASRSFGGLGVAVYQIGAGLEDVFVTGNPVYAINNVAFAVQSFAQQANLTTKQIIGLNVGMTALSLGTMALYNNWDRLVGLFGRGNDHLRTTAQRAREAADELAKVKFPTETEGFERRQAEGVVRRQESADETRRGLEGPTSEEGAVRGAFRDAFVQATGGEGKQATAEIRSQLQRQLVASDEMLRDLKAEAEVARAEARDAPPEVGPAAFEARAAAADQEASRRREVLRAVAENETAQLLHEAAKGNEAAMERLQTLLDRAGRGDVGRSLALAVEAARMAASGMDEEIARDQAENERRLEVRRQATAEEAERGEAATARFAGRRGERTAGVVSELQRRFDASGGTLDVGAALRASGINPTGNVSTDPTKIVSAQERAERDLAEARLRAIERVAAEEDVAFAEAEARFTRRRMGEERRARQLARDGETEGERAARRGRRQDAIAGGFVERTGSVDFATRMMMQLRMNREMGGAGMDAGQAADFVRNKALRFARRSQFTGGLGLNEESAQRFATMTVQRAAPQAQQALEEQFGGVISSARDLKTAVAEQNGLMRQALRDGVMLSLPRRGGGTH